MKRTSILTLAFVTLISAASMAQDTIRLFGRTSLVKTEKKPKEEHTRDFNNDGIQTIGGKGRAVGFYIGFNTGYTQIDHLDAFTAGAGIAMIANHNLAVGFAGKGFFTEPFRTDISSDVQYNYAGGYGGLLIEPIVMPRYPVHVSFPMLIGAGGIASNTIFGFNYPYEYTDFYLGDAEAFMVFEPGIDVEMNVARWLRFSMGGSYRITSSLDASAFKSDLMNGFSGEVSLKFGIF